MARKYSKRKVHSQRRRSRRSVKGRHVQSVKGRRVKSVKRRTRRSKKRMKGGMIWRHKTCFNRYLLTNSRTPGIFIVTKYKGNTRSANTKTLLFDEIKDLNWHSGDSPGSDIQKHQEALYNILCPITNFKTGGRTCKTYYKATKHSFGPISVGDCYYMLKTEYDKSIKKYREEEQRKKLKAEGAKLVEMQTKRRDERRIELINRAEMRAKELLFNELKQTLNGESEIQKLADKYPKVRIMDAEDWLGSYIDIIINNVKTQNNPQSLTDKENPQWLKDKALIIHNNNIQRCTVALNARVESTFRARPCIQDQLIIYFNLPELKVEL